MISCTEGYSQSVGETDKQMGNYNVALCSTAEEQTWEKVMRKGRRRRV